MGFVKTSPELMAAMGQTYDFFAAEMLTVYWLTKAEIVERLLPPPLKPLDEPLAYAFVADYARTNFGPPYREGALFLRAQFEGVSGGYCLAMPVTGDMAMAGGREIFGFPKKMADISLLKEDGRFEGSLKRHGQRFFQVQADLAAPPNDEAFLTIFAGSMTADDNGNIRAVSYNFKHFMAPEGMGFDYHPRLVKQTTLLRPQTTKFGRAEVTLSPSDCDPWHEVEVVKLLGAVYTVGDNQMLAGEVMTEVEEMAFAPHAFLKWDA